MGFNNFNNSFKDMVKKVKAPSPKRIPLPKTDAIRLSKPTKTKITAPSSLKQGLQVKLPKLPKQKKF